MKLSPSMTKEGAAMIQAMNNAKKIDFIFGTQFSNIKLVFISNINQAFETQIQILKINCLFLYEFWYKKYILFKVNKLK